MIIKQILNFFNFCKDYIECKDSLIKSTNLVTHMRELQINLFMVLIIMIFFLKYGSDNIFDTRAFHLLYDHKVLWTLRLKYLKQQVLITEKSI